MLAIIKLRLSLVAKNNAFLNIASLIVGGLLVLAFAPFEVRLITLLSLSILLLVIYQVSPKQAFIRCYCFGVGLFGFGVSWVYNSLNGFGDAPIVLAGLITALMIMILALFLGFMGYCQTRYFSTSLAVRALVVFPCVWVLQEWLRSWVLSGFPWLLLGYSQVDTILAPYIPVLGALGTGGVVAVIAGSLFLLFAGTGSDRAIAIFLSTSLLIVGVGLERFQWTQPSAEPIKVAVVQGNIPQKIKLNPEFLELSLNRYLELSRNHFDSKIIVWPETAVPTFKYYVEPFLSQLSTELEEHDVELLTGIFSLDPNQKNYYNSMYKVGSEREIYSKQQLVPFGEYMPFRWFLSFLNEFINIPMSDINEGDELTELITLQGIPIGITICYESAYAGILRGQLPEAQLLINASNDAWFGDSLAPHQHLEIARVRALESGRYLVRATNTGISAVIGPKGEILVRSEQNKQQVLSYAVEPRVGKTVFVWFGNCLPIGIALSLLSLVLLITKRKRSF